MQNVRSITGFPPAAVAAIRSLHGRPPVRRLRECTISLATLPLQPGSTGSDVADLQRRLAAAGFPTDDPSGTYGDGTERAVGAFQRSAGLEPDGTCDAATWSSLVEAGFSLGARLLCLRSPMMRGDDVAELQLRLGALGFDAGRVDGIFGPMTRAAVGEFQRNAGLVSDEVCGPETIGALVRLEGRGGTSPVTGVRERDRLRRRVRDGAHLRVAVGTIGEVHPAVTRLTSELQRAGHAAMLLTQEWSEQAAATNDFGADVYLGLVLSNDAVVQASYFSVPGYESDGGRQLAELVVREIPAAPGWTIGVVRGMRTPILRETRPPAVTVKLGDRARLDAHEDLVVASLHRALTSWSTEPC